MKKIILLVVAIVSIIALSLVGFMGCQGSTSLTQIFSEYNIWRSATLPETFTYAMYEGESTESMGTLTMTVERLSKSTSYYLGKTGLVEASDAIYTITTESVNDTYKATTTLTTADSKFTKTTIAIFTKNYQILGTYSYTNDNGTESAFVAHNVDNKRYYYKLSSNWDEEKAIKNGKYESAPYFDNTMIYFVARSMPEDSTYSAYSFNIFDLDKNSKEKVSLTNNFSEVTPVTINGATDPISSKKVTMTTSDSLLGTTNNISCYVSKEKYAGYSSVITKIVEGKYLYILNA